MKNFLISISLILISTLCYGQQSGDEADSIMYDTTEIGEIIIVDSFNFNYESETLTILNKLNYEINTFNSSSILGESTYFNFDFGNPTDFKVKVVDIERSCKCISINKPSNTFNPGQTIDFEAKIDFMLDKSYTIKLNVIFIDEYELMYFYQPIEIKINYNE
jgi:hypothetical protein